ncbi:MAG TPA: alpha-galactosidase [Armatimonadota bacterium]|jgi:alpha-galactosidase
MSQSFEGRPDLEAAQVWLAQALPALRATETGEAPCVSFVLGGVASAGLLPGWSLVEERLTTAPGVEHLSLTRTDPASGVELRVEFTTYSGWPVVEWIAYLRNTADHDSPLIEDLHSLDITLPGEGALLHSWSGDYCAADGYRPQQAELRVGERRSFAPEGGRPTNKEFPFYNLEYPAEQRGVIVVVGWPGQWAASFQRDEDGLHLTAGQEGVHLVLRPGEEIRTPRSVLLLYRGDLVDGQNQWRRWMFAHNLPRPGGKLPEPFMPGCSSGQFNEMQEANEENQILFIDRYLEEGVRLDYWWMDAGWYPFTEAWWKTGTWEVDTRRFPRGLRAITDHAHARGLKSLVWFEPERVTAGSWLDREHPEWLVDIGDGLNRLLNLGNPAALEWLTNHVDRLLTEQGIDLYRQDFNFDPLPFWRGGDAPDRQGITEIRHCEGYLAYWDALQARHPQMLLDSCASGGRRNDLETLRRGVPLHKTDYNYADLPVKQAFHRTLFSWMPFFAAPVVPGEKVDTYTARSAYAPCLVVGFDVRRHDLDYALLRKLTEEWRRIAPYYFGDYYPLTPDSRGEDTWMAWQFHRPESSDGLIQVFRRAESPYETARFVLRGLAPHATYRVEDLDTGEIVEEVGERLGTEGLALNLPTPRESRVLLYEAKR